MMRRQDAVTAFYARVFPTVPANVRRAVILATLAKQATVARQS